MTTDTPRTDAAYKDHEWDLMDHIPLEFARKLERELNSSQAEVERLEEQLTHFEDVHCKCVPRLKAEVERLTENAQRIGVNRYEQLKKSEAEVKKIKTEYWFMEAAMSKEIATLKEQRDEAIEIAEKIWADCSNGHEHTELTALKEEIK